MATLFDDLAEPSALPLGPVPADPPRPLVLDVFVPGKPTTAGSLKAFVNPKTGRPVVTVDNKQPQASWRTAVQGAVLNAWPLDDCRPLDGPVTVVVDFVMPRVASEPKRRTRPHTRKPDADKLLRAIMDALTHVVYTDDSRVDRGGWSKRSAEVGETPGARIRVFSVVGLS